MDETTLRLDGNACAGLLREVFANDLTAAPAPAHVQLAAVRPFV